MSDPIEPVADTRTEFPEGATRATCVFFAETSRIESAIADSATRAHMRIF